jgi:hypothetical protein
VASPTAFRVNAFRRLIALLAVPLNVLAVLWVVAGSALWPPVDSSAANLLRFVVGPVLVAGLGAATILMFLQRRRHVGITTPQAWLQTVLWTALFVFGLTFPALADSHGGASTLLRLTGEGALTSALSGLLWTISTFLAWGAGVALLALLIIGIDPKRQHVSAGLPSTADRLWLPR